MKNIKFLSLLVLVCAVLISGCTDITDMHNEYLSKGERIYVGKIDSLKVYGGYNRVQIVGLMRYANTAETCIIRWKNDSISIPVSQLSKEDTLKVIINNLEEGYHQFYVQTYDKERNKSLNETCSGYVYGDNYILTATAKFISLMTAEVDGLQLTWSDAVDALSVDFRYESNANGLISTSLPGDVKNTKIVDWKIGGNVEYRTAFLPEANAIDTLHTTWISKKFPAFVEFELSKQKFAGVYLPTDVINGYDGQIEGIWDNVYGPNGNGEKNRYHSGDGQGIPQHLTIDLGVYADLSRFEIWGRVWYPNWNPKKIQIWGIADITNAKTTLPSSDPGWEKESIAKGWKLISEGTCSDTDFNKFGFNQTAKNIRYIRYRVTEVWGPPSTGSGAYGCLQEMTIFSSNIKNIK